DITALRDAGQLDAARERTMQEFLPLTQEYGDAIKGFQTLQEQHAAAIRAEISDTRGKVTAMAGGMVVAVLVAMAFGAALLIRSIRQPLEEAIEAASRIAQGDLTVKIDAQGKDEISALMRALDGMARSLGTLVRSVRDSTDAIYTASSEIASGNQDLSTRTEQTASSLQETASSMEQLTSTVTQSAQAADEANQLATSASGAAQRGSQVVGEVVSTMQEIADSSRKIND